jgi:hypothetical protein
MLVGEKKYLPSYGGFSIPEGCLTHPVNGSSELRLFKKFHF